MAQDKTGGLAGITAGNTAIATVGKEGKGLTYRGYSIYDLAEHSTFEEVAYLLIYGRLPTESELNDYKARLVGLRGLPAPLKTVLEQIPEGTHPMDVMRTGCSMLGALEPEDPGRNQIAIANRLTGCFSAMLLYWHHFVTEGKRINTETDDDSTAGHFLHLLHQKKPDELHRRAIDVSLILYAEHEFNASTFTARTIASTLARFLFRGHRRHRRAARSASRRRQRSGDGADRPVQDARRCRERAARNDGGQETDHGIRP